jgi:hypothetical protein
MVDSTLTEYTHAKNANVAGMVRSGKSDAVVTAMNDFTHEMEVLAPILQKTNQIFSELTSGSAYPEALDADGQRLTESISKIRAAMMKTVSCVTEPHARQAMTAQAHAMIQAGR